MLSVQTLGMLCRTSYDAFNAILDKMHDPAYVYKISSESIKCYYHYKADDKR